MQMDRFNELAHNLAIASNSSDGGKTTPPLNFSAADLASAACVHYLQTLPTNKSHTVKALTKSAATQRKSIREEEVAKSLPGRTKAAQGKAGAHVAIDVTKVSVWEYVYC